MSIVPTVADHRPRPAADRFARGTVGAVVRRATGGQVVLIDDDSTGSGARDPGTDSVAVHVHDPAAYRLLLRHGSVGLGRSYVAGLWDTPDLVGLLRLATRHLPRPGGLIDRVGGWASVLRGAGSGFHDRRRDRSYVRSHYDLSDDLFSLFLDPTLSYSCAYFERPDMTLTQASVAKMDRLCAKLSLGPGDELLEIGTGWGSFAIHAASRYGARVTTTTISDHQYRTASRRVVDAGVSHLVTVRNDDYRDLEGTWDKLVSVEMVEAVGWRQYGRFFQTCSNLLRPHGLMALQAIVIDDRLYQRAKRKDDFVKAMIFPGSTIPSVASIRRSVAAVTDLCPIDVEDIGKHYAVTLDRWRSRFSENRSAIAALGFDESFLRLWDLYLAYCQAGFLEGRISDVQMMLAKPGWPSPGEHRW
ncbi:MAG: class I SAM-dependent methyltransferase [Acidimicrobiales bacterium]